MISLTELGEVELERARETSSGRAAHTIYGGHEHSLRQTLIALRSGAELAEHASPGEATLQVLRGHVRLVNTEDGSKQEMREGDFLIIPPAFHAVEALDDSVMLLTVAVNRNRAK
ncbi:cupin domain-containing protein [Actinomyces minihominis]|uniref:cupin domain-containing protein n=1 Tax=Actinomyces minihominis TaxID=2002838 RepID=UPI000C083E8F|nr:cupin domain-containing protein [Actinomyces minihominis]